MFYNFSQFQTFTILRNEGDEALANGNFFDSMTAYGKALEINPFSAKLYLKRSHLLFHRLKKHKEALEDAEYITLLKPTSVQVSAFILNNSGIHSKGRDFARVRTQTEANGCVFASEDERTSY